MRRSNKRKANQDTTISDLPNHVMCDILSRLPLNSIFTCNRVCKIWHNLILEPYLAKLHLSRSPLSLVFFRHGNSNKYLSYFEILQLHDPPNLYQHNATMKFRTEIYFPHTYVQMVASCNGSILLSNYASRDELVIIVCNPLRAHHLNLPEPPKLSPETHYLGGLGFSEWKFWVMKEYGDLGSWTLEWVIKGPITHEFDISVKLLKMLKDGTLLMMLEKYTRASYSSRGKFTTTVASYNLQTKVLKKIEYSDMLPRGYSFGDAPCLFSPMDALKQQCLNP
ncbi:hypothetical protein Vadar_009630 [Vaccinium darrowii]|uniref:Uncharacterized protein n=1 Tax=Vaccinium darrowii TaxID=229202 RepID=A0ACB7XPV1_9ERIC|nr:hypothetical protein Vadar_009630 [Vaccinium darrowii]